MNFIAGTLQAGQAGLKVASGAVVAIGPYPAEFAGREVEFGIRPEHILVSDADGLDARVEVVEPTGSETHIVIDAAGEKLVALIRRRIPIAVGDRLSLAFEEGQGHLFDAQNGQRLSPNKLNG